MDTLNKEPRAVLMEVKIIVVSFARKTPYLEHKVSCLILKDQYGPKKVFHFLLKI